VIPSTAGLEDVRRPVVIEQIVVASKPGSSRVNVALRWLDGTRTEGSGVAGFSREARARGAALAVLEALRPFLEARSVQVEVDQVQLHRMADVDVALVRVFLLEAGRTIQLMGTARLDDDVASAAARALLDAVNRKLSLL
jgi:hypothetical protein